MALVQVFVPLSELVLVGLPLVFVKFVQQFALSLLRLVVVVLILVVLKPLVLIFLPLSDLVVVAVETGHLVVEAEVDLENLFQVQLLGQQVQ